MKTKTKLAVCLWVVVLGIGAMALWIASPTNPEATRCHPTADTSLDGTLRDLGAGLTGIVAPKRGR